MIPTLAFGLGGPFDLLILFTVIFLVCLPTVFWIVEIVDVARRSFYEPNNKIIWILVVIFLHFIGALVYYFVGKKQGTLPGEQRYV